jgi:putative ABC transport system substrate-binding protein
MNVAPVRWWVRIACGCLFSTCLSVQALADQPAPVARIGVLNPQIASTSMEEALRQGLLQLGYTEGKNIAIEWRRSASSPEAMRALATDLVASQVDVIVALGSPATRAALEATTKPVVFLVGDPVASGFAASLARPGGNGTGVSVLYPELVAKQLELLHELVPRARRVIHLINRANPGFVPSLATLEQAAKRFGIHLVILSAENPDQMDHALRKISHDTGDAVLVGGDLLALASRHKIAEAVRKAKLPAMFPFKQYHEAGVLISYGANYDAAMSQIASYVDRVLKGAKPAVLPIEQVSRYELVLNVRLAQELGIQIPKPILARADEVMQ